MNSAGLNKERNQETKKQRKKQRHSMKSKRPCLQHWPKNTAHCNMGSNEPNVANVADNPLNFQLSNPY